MRTHTFLLLYFSIWLQNYGKIVEAQQKGSFSIKMFALFFVESALSRLFMNVYWEYVESIFIFLICFV